MKNLTEHKLKNSGSTLVTVSADREVVGLSFEDGRFASLVTCGGVILDHPGFQEIEILAVNSEQQFDTGCDFTYLGNMSGDNFPTIHYLQLHHEEES